MSAADFVACARKQLGKPYVWGTAGPNTFDCSGLVAFCHEAVTGEVITRSSHAQAKLGTPVPDRAGAIEAGDLVFWGTDGTDAGHVGIATGTGTVVNALNEQRDVVETRIDAPYGGPLTQIRRLSWKDGGETSPPKGGTMTDHAVAGSTKKLRLPDGVDFDIQLTTVSPNRTYQKRSWTGTTQHTTNNNRTAMGARAHAQWQARGTQGHPDGAVSVHFYVDDTIVIQTLPVDETGIHSGDWRNTNHTAVELCTNQDRNVARAEANAIALQAGLLLMLGTSAEETLYPHTDGGHCPRLSVSWAEYEKRVARALTTLKTTAITPPVPDVGGDFVGLPAWLPPAYFKAAFPLADPKGAVTKEVIGWVKVIGRVPWFIGKVDVGNGRNLWRFAEFTLLSEGSRVWIEGEE